MKIGIDARFFGPWGTGLGRYVAELIVNLEKVDEKNEYIIFLRRGNFGLYRPKNKNFKKVLADTPWYSFSEQWVIPQVALKEKLDLLHVPHFNIPIFYPGKMVITIHDLIKSEFATTAATTRSLPVYLFKHYAYEAVIRLATNRASKIFVPSNYVSQKLQTMLAVPKKKVVVTYEASSLTNSKKPSPVNSQRILDRYGIKKPYLLYVGNAYPYKNLDRLLDALKLIDSDINLVNPCPRTVFYERLSQKAKKLRIADRVMLPGFIPDDDLLLVYKEAEAYVFPSLSEGFGIPGLDAMAQGLPVVSSNLGALPEIYSDAALYFEPQDLSDMADKIKKVLNDQNLREKLIERGLSQVKKYSWQKMARQTLEVYLKIK